MDRVSSGTSILVLLLVESKPRINVKPCRTFCKTLLLTLAVMKLMSVSVLSHFLYIITVYEYIYF